MLHHPGKCQATVRQHVHRHIVRPGSIVIDQLPVVGHRQLQLAALQLLDHKVRLLYSLLLTDGLGEEIDPHLESGSLCALVVLPEHTVRHNVPAAVGAVANADEYKIDAGRLHLVPVNIPLVGGHVNAHVGSDLSVADIIPSAVPVHDLLPVLGKGRHVIIYRQVDLSVCSITQQNFLARQLIVPIHLDLPLGDHRDILLHAVLRHPCIGWHRRFLLLTHADQQKCHQAQQPQDQHRLDADDKIFTGFRHSLLLSFFSLYA